MSDSRDLKNRDRAESLVSLRVISSCIVCFVILVCMLSSGDSYADRIVLKEGQILTGDIIAERPEKLYIDIGITILSVSRDKILEYQRSNGSAAKTSPGSDVNDASTVPDESEPNGTDLHRLYRTANLEIKTITECVEDVSQAVVKVASPGGSGSGFFVNEDGYLITNYHVIERETRIEIIVFRKTDTGFERTTFKKVKIEAINPFVDLALLKVEDLGSHKVQPVFLGDINRVEVGQHVFAIGNPLGLERTVTNGVISTKSRAFEGLVYLQTNTDINPGNSGGPLFNLAGEVIGVTNMGYIFYGGLGFAIPVDYVKHFIDNREAFTYDKDNPNTGYRYIQPDQRTNRNKPKGLLK